MAEAWHVGRTMRVLELLAFAPLSAPQLAAALHAHPRTMRRVLAQLVEDEYLTCTEDRHRRYAPTMRLVALAAQVVDNSPVGRCAEPYLRLLADRTGATAHVMLPSYDKVVCVAHADPGDARDDAGSRVRELVPAHATAAGKALLAHRERWCESLLARPLEPFTDATITDPQRLRQALAEVRRAGHATEDGEHEPALRAVAAPLRVGSEVVGALAVSGPRLDLAATLPHLHSVAADVQAELAA